MTSSTESDKIDLILQVDAECGVLIETLWNVNKRVIHHSSYLEAVLIETLWNVNMTSEIPGIKKMEY